MYGLSRVTSRRVIRIGSFSQQKRDNKRMPLGQRSFFGFGSGLCLIAATNAPSLARGALNFRNAQLEPLSFSALDGWKNDDHALAFETFLKSCNAILNAGKGVRTARPFLGALHKSCEHAVAAGRLDREQARAFFETNFKPVQI